ncbi:ATP-binding cassette domain-containing protein [Weissella confusa]|uniref:type IV secretory system conjugative DNA transfer family protein n=1 Tax=Weissella confusa TaxID=1583 RepID=UPI00223B39F2|nr:AAA family ATPase [Weissella confusa]MCT0042176.1 ATP-binding cassette domain-containing protein [Weissella confusa]
MNQTEMTKFITGVLNAALSREESSIKQSFQIEISTAGFFFILRYPSSLVMDNELYFRIFDIVSAAVYPYYTLIRPSGMQLVARDGSVAVGRALFFPWKEGTPQRLIGTIGDILSVNRNSNRIPVMHGIDFNFNKAVHVAITGNTGSGKSTALRYFLEVYHTKGSIILIDPKKSDGARWARGKQDIQIIVPANDDRPEDFLPRVNEVLAGEISEISRRQSLLFDKSPDISTDYRALGLKPHFVVIDEVASLAVGLKKPLLDEFHALLTQISLLGREAGVFLTLSLQEARQSLLPTEVRSQMGVRILLGRIDKNSAQFLFPELDSSFPLPIGGRGTGIISINDGEHFGVEPVAMPTITEE